MRQHPLVGEIVAGLLKFIGFLVVGAAGLGLGLVLFLRVVGFACEGGFEERCITTANPIGWIFAWAILGVVTIIVIAVWYAIFSGWHRRGDAWLGAALVAVAMTSVIVDDLISSMGVVVWLTTFSCVGVVIRLSRGVPRRGAVSPEETRQGATTKSGFPPMDRSG